MFVRLRDLFDAAEPAVDQRITLRLLHWVLGVSLIAQFVLTLLLLLFPTPLLRYWTTALGLLFTFVSLGLLWRGSPRQSAWVLVSGLWLTITLACFTFAGVRTPSFAGYIVVILLASLLINEAAAVLIAALTIAAALGMLIAELEGLLPVAAVLLLRPEVVFFVWMFVIILTALTIFSSSRSLRAMLVRVRQSERQALEHSLRLEREIDDRRTAERERDEMAGAKARAAFLADFLRDVSHDLKTPLTVIETSLYLLERIDDRARQHEKIDQIREQTRLVERFLQDILMISRLDYEPELDRQPVDINALLTDVARQLRPGAERKHLQTELHLFENPPPVHADQEQLRRAFVNLVENAIRYTPQAGRIEIATRLLPQTLEIAIADTGIGIGADELPYIFERFYRSDEARVLEQTGTGLGLAIVKKVLDLHAYGIVVSSSRGHGTTFRVHIPVN